MAREKKLVIGAINLTIQPHTPQMYVKLFKDAYRLKRPLNISGHQFGILAGVYKLNMGDREPCPITGDVFKYTDISKNASWFNTETNDFATEEDVGEIVIPRNLKPNSSRFAYILYPDQHLLFYEGYYEGKSFGPTNAIRFFDKLLNQEELTEKYGKVDITHIPEVNELEEAFNLPVKERISMVIQRPNPDDHAEAERRVLRRMQAQNVETFEQNYKAIQGQSINMDDELQTMARVSARNGSFFLKGKNFQSRPVEYSTKEHPLVRTKYYDPDAVSPGGFFQSISQTLKEEIRRWFNL